MASILLKYCLLSSTAKTLRAWADHFIDSEQTSVEVKIEALGFRGGVMIYGSQLLVLVPD